MMLVGLNHYLWNILLINFGKISTNMIPYIRGELVFRNKVPTYIRPICSTNSPPVHWQALFEELANMNARDKTLPIADVQTTADTRKLAIDRVGINAIHHPVPMRDRAG